MATKDHRMDRSSLFDALLLSYNEIEREGVFDSSI